MALADLPNDFVTFSRDQIVERYKRDYLLRNPEADVVSGQPDLDANLAADLVTPTYYDARLIADGINEDAATGPRLDLVGNRIGLPRPAATGASGYVAVSASAGGGTIQKGDELENPQTKKKYEAAETRHRNSGEHIRVRAKSKGPETDVAPGIVLRWTSPRPGIGQNATVVEQSDGRGLSGGAEAQNDERYRATIRERRANPIGGDNTTELSAVIRSTPDVPVEQTFIYPGVYGPGTTAFTFTVLAPRVGSSRLPTDAQVIAALDWVRSQMPGDHQYFPLVPTANALVLALELSWATGGWADAVAWPDAYSRNVKVDSASSPTSFVLSGTGTAPVAGQTVGFWDRNNLVFQRKRFASVTGGGPWTIVCETTNGASDTTYTPQVNQRCSPWSDNLQAVHAPVLAYLATLGVGELFSPSSMPSEEGRGRLREPKNPKAWPYATSSKILVDVAAIDQVQDADAAAGVGSAVTPSLPPKMHELSDLAVYPA